MNLEKSKQPRQNRERATTGSLRVVNRELLTVHNLLEQDPNSLTDQAIDSFVGKMNVTEMEDVKEMLDMLSEKIKAKLEKIPTRSLGAI